LIFKENTAIPERTIYMPVLQDFHNVMKRIRNKDEEVYGNKIEREEGCVKNIF